VLAQDETDLLLFPPLRRSWAPLGQQAHVPISGHNAKRVVFGCVNIKTGQLTLLVRKKHRGEDFQAFLEQVRKTYRGRPIVMLLDEDSSHTAHASVRLAKKRRVRLLWLPKRSPHLNPVDHLWRDPKQKICANHQEPTIEALVVRFMRYLLALPPEDVLRKAGLLSSRFWLHRRR
jgi:hypothetical protein